MLKKNSMNGLLLVLVLAAVGCQRNCRWMKAVAGRGQQPVVKKVDHQPSMAELPTRGWQEDRAYYQNIGIEHPALYMQSCYDKYGSQDGKFGTWRWEDAFSLGASTFIFLGDVVVMPVCLAEKHPWQPQQSRSIFTRQQGPVYELPTDTKISPGQ